MGQCRGARQSLGRGCFYLDESGGRNEFKGGRQLVRPRRLYADFGCSWHRGQNW